MRPPSPSVQALKPCLFLLLSLLTLSRCQGPRLPPATGSVMDIVLLGEALPLQGGVVLRSVLGESFPPLRSEDRAFRLVPGAGAQTLGRPREKNVLILGRTDQPAIWEPTFGSWMPSASRVRLGQDGAGWFAFRDVWARGQDVVLLVATGASGLDSLLQADAPALRRYFLNRGIQRCLESAWADTATAWSRELRRRHGFVFAVPASYTVEAPSSSWPAAVELVRPAPSRSLTVFWLDQVEPQDARSVSFLLGMQQDAMWRLHGDEVVDPRWDSTEGGLPVLQGSWQNQRDIAGGPFITRFVYDRSRRRLYGVQALLFAPGQRKAAFLVEMEGLLRTFHVERES